MFQNCLSILSSPNNDFIINSKNYESKNFNYTSNSTREEIIKNNELNDSLNKNNIISNDNKISGVLFIGLKEINDDIYLFKTEISHGIDVYINNKKINLKKKGNEWKIHYNFPKEGKYRFDIVFKEIITNFENFFENCNNLIELDLSCFDTSCVKNLSHMLYKCINLKEIIGIDNIITNKITNMSGLFSNCSEL